jgi:hypothetical protein
MSVNICIRTEGQTFGLVDKAHEWWTQGARLESALRDRLIEQALAIRC